MNVMTVSEVSKSFDVSTRMLRYYEKMGLISSGRREDYAYRIYDEDNVRRLQLIIVLRKLRIPLKQIAVILSDEEQIQSLEILKENIAELNGEIETLTTIREILGIFVSRLQLTIKQRNRLDLLGDEALLAMTNVLSLSKLNLKEEYSVNDLNKAQENLIMKANVRIVLLPAFTVASYHYIGENPEDNVSNVMDRFVRESKLYEIKPDSRWFGFNHPNPGVREDGLYGYEAWVTILDDMEVPAPLVKKQYGGGLYAAHTMDFPNFHEWQWLIKWCENNDKYTPNYSELGDEIMGGLLEEHLNWVYSCHMGWPENGIDGKLDLLLPIKKK